MEQLFNYLYGLFKSLYGVDLYDFLVGVTCSGTEFLDSQFVRIGAITFFITLACVLFYYYILDMLTDCSQWWHWLLSMLVTGVVNLLVGYALTNRELPNVEDCFEVGTLDCWMFGLANLLLTVVMFFLLSLLFKWWSKNCRRTPF